jgi:Protein of unknown function (DUF4236)/Putative peptidoglycan binding domain
MGFRFRRSISLGKLMRVSISKSGMSLGLGPRGFNVNVSSRGVRKTVGIPGTGLSYQTFNRWKSPTPLPIGASSYRTHEEPVSEGLPSPGPDTSPAKWLFIGVGAFFAIVIGVRMIGGAKSPEASVPAAAADTLKSKLPQSPASPSPTAAIVGSPSAPPAADIANRPLTSADILEIQTKLKALGFNPGPLDGITGPQTEAAIKAYAATMGATVNPVLSIALLERLRKERGAPTSR